MSNLSDIPPEFARPREQARRGWNETRSQLFEEYSEREERRRWVALDKVIAAAKDAQPNLKTDTAIQPNPDLIEFQKALERKGDKPNLFPSLESRIKHARDA